MVLCHMSPSATWIALLDLFSSVDLLVCGPVPARRSCVWCCVLLLLLLAQIFPSADDYLALVWSCSKTCWGLGSCLVFKGPSLKLKTLPGELEAQTLINQGITGRQWD